MLETPQQTRVVIPYTPRSHFIPFHNRKKRHCWEVVHRRGGKTVAIANELIKWALQNNRSYPPPRYAYVGPSYGQAKDTIWNYLKHYTKPIPGIRTSEELFVTFPNGATITLYPGADAYERMRGVYFDGVALDEYPLLNPDAWLSVVRPCLSDYRGRAIIAGTSAGNDHFYEMKKKAEADPENWDVFDIKVSETDCLHPDEVAEMRLDMGNLKFAREMMNDFSSPVENAYYAEQLIDSETRGDIRPVPWDPKFPVYPSFDLGTSKTDEMVVCFWQKVGREIRQIESFGHKQKGLDFFIKKLRDEFPYTYGEWIFPHDIDATELTTGKNRKDLLDSMNVQYVIVPRVANIMDRISAVRIQLRAMYIDNTEKNEFMLNALRSYQPNKSGIGPKHDWASHWADAFGTGVMGLDLVGGWTSGPLSRSGVPLTRSSGALKRNISGIV